MTGSNTSSTSTTAEPWGPTQDDLKKILNEAEKLYSKDKGYNPYPEQTWVDPSAETQQAWTDITNLASQPNPFYQPSADFTTSLISGGQNLDTSSFEALQGKDAISVNPQLQSLMGETATALDQYGRPIASGEQSINTEADYRALYDSYDENFDAVVQDTADTLTDQINRSFGGASFGSGSHTDYLTDQVGDVVSQMYSDQYNQDIANKTNILNSIGGVQGQNISNQLGAATSLSGEQAGNLAAQAGILGQIGGFQGQNADFQRGLAGDIANLQAQDIQNQLAGIGVADSVYNSQYLPSQMLAGVGESKESYDAAKLQAEMDAWNAKQQEPWDQLMSYFGIATGTGATGGETASTVSQPTDPLSSILGALLLGTQAI